MSVPIVIMTKLLHSLPAPNSSSPRAAHMALTATVGTPNCEQYIPEQNCPEGKEYWHPSRKMPLFTSVNPGVPMPIPMSLPSCGFALSTESKDACH